MSMGLPLYSVIYSDIKRDILSGKLRPGDILPKESLLAQKYGSSKAPIRQAMGKLEMEGLIIRKQGKGTFIADKLRQSRLLLFSGFRTFYSHHLEEIRCKTLMVHTTFPSAEISRQLHIREGKEAIHVHRVRYWSQTPIFSIHTYFPEEMGIETFRKAGHYFSVAEVLFESFGLLISYAEERITATLANEEQSTVLRIPINSPLLQIDRISYSPSGKAIYYTQYFGRSELCPYETTFDSGLSLDNSESTFESLAPKTFQEEEYP